MFLDDHCRRKCKHDERKRRENSGHWLYCHFRDIFGALPRVHFLHTIYRFEAREVRSPTLQTVSKSELKQKSYGHCKKTGPSWAGISHTSIQGAKQPLGTRVPFRTPQSNFHTVRNKVQKFRTPLFKVRNSFQGAKISVQGASVSHTTIQGAKIFAPCETTSWHTSAISHTSSHFSHRAKQGTKISHSAKLSAKLDSRCEILILRCENFATVGHNFEALPGA